MQTVSLEKWRQELEFELNNNILSFWINHAYDQSYGGFVGALSNDLAVNFEADKGVVLTARILWTYSSAYRLYKDQVYLNMAEAAYQYLISYFLDGEHGGYYWMLNNAGEPVQENKLIYGQAFVIYALAEYVRAVPNKKVLNQAVEAFELVEAHSYDQANKGYYESFDRFWHATDDFSLGNSGLYEKKSMNTHLHLLEAYTNLYRVWKSDVLKEKLIELLYLFTDRIIDPETHHFHLFFDEAWGVLSSDISYGHDIEGSWLLLEAAVALEDKGIIELVKKIAVDLAQATYNSGQDVDGGIFNEANADGWIDSNKSWWPQAEAMVGFLNAYEITGLNHFLEASFRTWLFIDNYIVDKRFGEWHWNVDRSGVANSRMPKISVWKCPYHNSRACMETMNRLRRLDLGR